MGQSGPLPHENAGSRGMPLVISQAAGLLFSLGFPNAHEQTGGVAKLNLYIHDHVQGGIPWDTHLSDVGA
jgi:hypothetical protein